jgi:PemK-like, MazF-like toxin of type II toxin-antitoxin system
MRAAVRTLTRPSPTSPSPPTSAPPSAPPSAGPEAAAPAGSVQISYDPRPDGQPDPGEVVWTWVPYEEDPSKGKDRPVLVIGRKGDQLLALPLTSKDHDRDADDEARWGRHWMDIGSGGWDPRGRPSEVRLDRVLELDPGAVRREGAVLPEAIFDQVAGAARSLNGWS